MRDLVNALRSAAQAGKSVIVIRRGGLGDMKQSLRHERFHATQAELAGHLGRFTQSLLDNPLAQDAANYLAQLGYRPQDMATEIGAHLAAAQHERLGLTLGEAQRLWFHYLSMLHTLHGAKLTEATRNIAPALKETYRRATGQETRTGRPDRTELDRGPGGGEEGPQGERRVLRQDGGQPDGRSGRQAAHDSGVDSSPQASRERGSSEPPSVESTPQLRDADEQRVRESTLRSLQADPEGYFSRYTEQFGNVLNADDAATLFDEYRADPAKYRVAVHPAAVGIRDDLFRQRLARPEATHVIFTAGSNAAGKSTAIRQFNGHALAILDSTFSDLPHARGLLRQALAAGKPAQILCVRRPLSEAFQGMLDRAGKEGRVVSIAQMINSDAGAANVVRDLARVYAGDPRVSKSAKTRSAS